MLSPYRSMIIKILLSCFFLGTLGDQPGELVSTVIIFRHGERTPRVFHPRDPYRSYSYWLVPKGELTENGIKDAYELGAWTRERYGNFVASKYHPDDFFLYSSAVDRTLISASAFAAGFYPPLPNTTVPHQPIPIHSKPRNLDQTIFMWNKHCPRREYLLMRLLNTPDYKKIDEKNAKLYEIISTNTGMKVESFLGLETLYDTFFIEEQRNLQLPEWVHQVYPEQLREIALHNLQLVTYTKPLARLEIGPLFGEILNYLQSFTNTGQTYESAFERGTRGRKMMAVSGHDSNIGGLLYTLGHHLDDWPRYSSAVIVELRRQQNSELFVKVFHKKSKNELIEIKVGDCGYDCSLKKFADYLKDVAVSPKDKQKYCWLIDEEGDNPDMS